MRPIFLNPTASGLYHSCWSQQLYESTTMLNKNATQPPPLSRSFTSLLVSTSQMHSREIDLTDSLLNLDAILCAPPFDNLQNAVTPTWTAASPRDEVGEIVAAELRSRLPMLDERGILETKVNHSRGQRPLSSIHCHDL